MRGQPVQLMNLDWGGRRERPDCLLLEPNSNLFYNQEEFAKLRWGPGISGFQNNWQMESQSQLTGRGPINQEQVR